MENINTAINKKSRNKRIKDHRFALIIIPVVLIISFVGIFVKYKKQSSYDLSINTHVTSSTSILDGSKETQYEAYVDDKFFLKDTLNTLNSKFTSLLGQHEKNGVIKGKDNYLIDVFDTPDEDLMSNQVDAINAFAKGNAKDVKTSMCIVPTKVNVLKSKMPISGYSANQATYIDKYYGELNKNVTTLDVTDTLKEHNDEDIYFKTDSTWTSLGAYYAYGAIAADMEYDTSDDKFESLAVATDFRGDLSYRSGLNSSVKENLYIYFNSHKEFDTVVTYIGNKKAASIYNSNALNTNSKLDVILGEQSKEVKVDSTCINDDTLLLVTDRYGKAILPFLTSKYQTIIVLDANTFKGSLNNYITTKNATEVMFLMSANTLAKCDNLAGMLE